MMILGVILPCYTRSEDQLADVFTKAARQKTMESIHISFSQSDSSWFDWNDEEAVLFPNWETGIT
ncbi:unnamed protein product [Brassica rapa subsp. trilocularis]